MAFYFPKRFAFIQWEDGYVDVIGIDKIAEPKKTPDSYNEGEYVVAFFGAKVNGKTYKARISDISVDKTFLIEKRDAKPYPNLKFYYGRDVTESEKNVKSNIQATIPVAKESSCKRKRENVQTEVQTPPKARETMNNVTEKDTSTTHKMSVKSNSELINPVATDSSCEIPRENGSCSKELANIFLEKPRKSSQEHQHKNCVSRKEFDELKDDLKRLKRRVRDLEGSKTVTVPVSQPPLPSLSATPPPVLTTAAGFPTLPQTPPPASSSATPEMNASTFNGHSVDDLLDAIGHIDNLYLAVKTTL